MRQPSQTDKFIKAARALAPDESEENFNKKLGKLSKKESKSGKKAIKSILFLFFLLAPATYAADKTDRTTPPPMPLDLQESDHILNKALGEIENLRLMTENITVEKKNECMKAIGNTDFCECIVESVPIAVSFLGYVNILVKTKDELNYNTLSVEDKMLVDKSRVARDKCVTWKNKR